EALERLGLIQQSKEYQEIQKLPKTINGKQNPERTKAFNELNRKYGFTDYDIQHYATGIRNSWMEEHIHAHIAQKLATRAFKAVQKKAFGMAKNVRFKGKNQMDSLEGKNNETGLRFKDNTLYWSDLEIPCIIDSDNDLIQYGLTHKVKYCRIVRRKINGKNRFYLQLILEGTSYQNPKNKHGTEEIGLDVGTGTIATVADTKATLKQFCNELIPDQKKKRKLQRKLDRSLRATNPDNYNPNGTVKKGKKFKKSNRYKAVSQDLAETDRILAAHRKSLHGKDINEIIAMGTRIKTENVSYKSWQKRYGRSIGMRAPSMFMNSLKIKAENAGGYLFEFPTQTTKLSQTCHICEQQVKKRLSKRWHICCGIQMQRDLYSAFLAKCVEQETSALDLVRAKQLWKGMESILSDAISRAKQTAIGKVCPASFGFKGIQSQSGSLVNSVRIISEAMDAVILPDESHRELI
ncbi:MAG TPA: zinc ribbon domain-containing protein, partial [Candidatus Methanoperedens sp.]|nr:zinc ribbon domain-containing protein [Candidatus Methanoperedens sp.]